MSIVHIQSLLWALSALKKVILPTMRSSAALRRICRRL
jgi:hypothetical protein